MNQVKLGDRVKVVISPESLEFGCDKVYPQDGTGTVTNCIRREKNLGFFNAQERLVHIHLDVPFKRTGLVADEDLPKAQQKKFEIMADMWIPIWILEPFEPEK